MTDLGSLGICSLLCVPDVSYPGLLQQELAIEIQELAVNRQQLTVAKHCMQDHSTPRVRQR